MNKNVSVGVGIALAALVLGALGGYALGMSRGMMHAMNAPTMEHGAHMQAQMDAMTASLNGLSGDAFDRAFLAEMIVHHEGAVEMAEAALARAGHQEIRDLAEAIISAQMAEIAQMRDWQQAWFGE